MTAPPDDGELIASTDIGQVGRLARRGAAWSGLLIVARYSINVATTAILARLLLPSDYGIMGMVATLTAFLQTLADGGLSWATVQRKELSRSQASNLFWANTGVGALLWLGCVLAGPLLRQFYGRTELPPITAVIGVSFLFSGIAAQPVALLQREMRFKHITFVELLGQAAGVTTAVALALRGHGYWALAWQPIATHAGRVISVFTIGGYRPGAPRTGQGTGALVKLGGYLAAFSVINYFARNVDNIVVGKVWGADQLGFYSRAYFLMMLPTALATSTLTRVMVPSLATLAGDRERMGAAYRKVVQIVAFVGFPLAGGLAVTAPEAVRLVYGARWLPVVPILMWLSIAGITQPVQNTMDWLYIACGRGRAMFRWGIVNSLLLGLGFVIGVYWGAVGVAVSYALLMTLVTVPSLYFAHRAAGLALLPTLRPLVPVLGAALIMMAVATGVGFGLGSLGANWAVILVGKVVAGVLTYGVSGVLLLHELPLQLSFTALRSQVARGRLA